MAVWNTNKSSRYLWCTLVIATTAVCGVFIYIGISTERNRVSSYQSSRDHSSSPEKLTDEKCISVCGTSECVYQSKLILDHIKQDVNPCDDFHQFACGKMIEKFGPEKYYTKDDLFGDLLISKVKNILDTLEADPRSASGKMKTVYDSCMKYSSNEFQAVPTILRFIENLGIQGWPNLAPDFEFVNPDFTRIIANFLLYEEYGFVEFSTKDKYTELEENFLFDVKINTSLKSPKSSYEGRDKPTRKYLVNRMLSYFNQDVEKISAIWEESEAIHDAITNLRQESTRIDNEKENSTAALLDCRQDTENEWKNLCDSLESLIEIAGAAEEVNQEFASIEGPEIYFMENIFPVLRNFTDRSIANYLALNVLLNNMNELNSYFYLSRKKEEIKLNEMQPSLLKWKKCVMWITDHLTVAVGHEYMKNDFTLSMIQEVQDLSEECFREAADLISQQKWAKEESLVAVAAERINESRVDFDYYIKILPNETEVNRFYELMQYHPTDGNFLHNVLEHKKSIKVLELRGQYDTHKTFWMKYLFKTDAFGGEEIIDVYFGYLLPPVFLSGIQRIMNLVSLGSIILHEIGHYVDLLIDIYSKTFEAEAKKYFEDKFKCIEDQYSQFRFESIGENLNGSRYLSENIADTIGMTILDKLIEKYVSNYSIDLLPSLQYSLKQQLYIYSAQMWCSIASKEIDELYHTSKIHSPDRFRLLGMMQNSEGFSEAFGCPEGNYLNPATKCSLFD